MFQECGSETGETASAWIPESSHGASLPWRLPWTHSGLSVGKEIWLNEMRCRHVTSASPTG